MEKKNMTGAYHTPTTEVLDVIAEGVLCASGIIDGAGEDQI